MDKSDKTQKFFDPMNGQRENNILEIPTHAGLKFLIDKIWLVQTRLHDLDYKEYIVHLMKLSCSVLKLLHVFTIITVILLTKRLVGIPKHGRAQNHNIHRKMDITVG